MLKHPVVIRFPAFEVTDREGEIALLDRFRFALAPDPHNTAGRRAHILPITAAHRILIDPPQIRLGRSRQLRQGLRIDFGGQDTPDLHRI